jgi:hypothetical protein
MSETFLSFYGKLLVSLVHVTNSRALLGNIVSINKIFGIDYSSKSEHRNIISGKHVFVLGSAVVGESERERVRVNKKNGYALIGTGWSGLIYENIDVFVSGHCAHVISALIGRNRPAFILHALPRPCLPIFKDTHIIKRIHVNNESEKDILGRVMQYRNGELDSSHVVLSLSNALFLGIFIALINGAKSINLVGFDPLNPEYGFGMEDLCKLNQSLIFGSGAELDYVLGSSSMLPAESLNKITAGVNSKVSGCGTRNDNLYKSLNSMKNICAELGVPVCRVGKSDFLCDLAEEM